MGSNSNGQYYHSDIAAKAVIELTNAINDVQGSAYALALLADQRMSGEAGHLASCGINPEKVKKAKAILIADDAQTVSQVTWQRAIQFLDELDHEQYIFNA